MINAVTALKTALVASIVFASLFVAALARAADPVEADVRVRVIHARTGEKKFDPKLEDLRKYLTVHSYSSYRQVIDQTLHVGVADQANTKGIGLLSGKTLTVTLVSLTKEKATIRLLLVGQTGQMLDTTVSVGSSKLFFIAGPRFDDGVLFIAISPSYGDAVDPNVVDSRERGAPTPK